MSGPLFGRGRRDARTGPPGGPWRLLFDTLTALVILALVGLIALRLGVSEPRRSQGQAIVNDGDTLTLGKERIRLKGIDAPEYHQSCRQDGADYPCGRRAREALVGLIGGRPVECSGNERDRYGRLLAACRAGPDDLNRGLVASGWAVAYGAYGDVEEEARRAGRGVWAGSFELPRDWRARNGDAAAELRTGWLARLAAWLLDFGGFSAPPSSGKTSEPERS